MGGNKKKNNIRCFELILVRNISGRSRKGAKHPRFIFWLVCEKLKTSENAILFIGLALNMVINYCTILKVLYIWLIWKINLTQHILNLKILKNPVGKLLYNATQNSISHYSLIIFFGRDEG